ncbi:MAG: ascorbate-specific PTS system EIIC-type component UlaA [Verrucomicrobiales bacterium]|jgi:ascorbate-specific PTS system EIIC-type component UlaA
MDDERLDQLLDELKHDDSIPAPPTNLESRVLREIRLQGGDADEPEAGWISLMLNRALAFAGAVAVVALGIGLIIGSMAPSMTHASQALAAREALALDVFHPHSGDSPHSLLHQ